MGAAGFSVSSSKSIATWLEEAAEVMPESPSPPTPGFHCWLHGHSSQGVRQLLLTAVDSLLLRSVCPKLPHLVSLIEPGSEM